MPRYQGTIFTQIRVFVLSIVQFLTLRCFADGSLRATLQSAIRDLQKKAVLNIEKKDYLSAMDYFSILKEPSTTIDILGTENFLQLHVLTNRKNEILAAYFSEI